MPETLGVLVTSLVQIPTVFEPVNLLYLLIGLLVGIFWGAVPALSSTMAVALLIGFSAALPTHAAIAFLLAIYSGSVFGGSISAVCTNIPGTPAATCTALEGYPLFRRGEGGRALGTAIAASTLGNLFGALILILFTPYLLKLALSVGAWEVFLLGLWGVLISGSVAAGGSVAKGWVAGMLGLALSFVGVDPISGELRFTYGYGFLYGGIGFIAVLIGLFGFAEIARGLLMEEHIEVSRLGNRVQISWRTLGRNVANVLRSSTLGAVVGAIPAAGADIAAFLAYSSSRRSAKPADQELYGRGSYRGIIAAESANNSSVGGSLLPLLVLAIPGSTVAAAFLGALNLQGIQVGPMIKMSHPGLIEYIFATMLVVSVLMGLVALLVTKAAVVVLSMPRTVLLPCIMPICVLGAFAAQNVTTDIYVMAAAGVAGIALSAAGYPLTPIVMGLILGPLVDQNFRRAMIIFREQSVLEVLSRPLGAVLLLVLLATVARPLVRMALDRSKKNVQT